MKLIDLRELPMVVIDAACQRYSAPTTIDLGDICHVAIGTLEVKPATHCRHDSFTWARPWSDPIMFTREDLRDTLEALARLTLALPRPN